MVEFRLAHSLYLPILFLLFFPHIVLASDLPPSDQESAREQAIQREFDCIQRRMNEQEKPTWQDVCYTGTAWESPQDHRAKLIDQALDSADPNRTGSAQDAVVREKGSAPETQKKYSVKPEDRETDVSRKITKPAPKTRSRITSSAIQLKEHQIDLGTEFYFYSYKEPVFDLELEGLQYGVSSSYTYRPQPDDGLYLDVINMYKLDARFAFGPVDYSSTPSGTIDNEDNYVFETRGVMGYDHFFHDRFLLTPYVGLGFRYLNNDSGGQQSTTGAYGYERVSNYFYLPLGVDLVYQINNDWRMTPNFEWDVFLLGEQTSYLSDVNSGYPDIENDQNRGYGVRGAFKIMKTGSDLNFWIEPFFRYWHIQDSDVTTAVGNVYALTGLEPDNNTTEYGLKLGVAF